MFQNLDTAPDAKTAKFLQPDVNFCGPGMFAGPASREGDVCALGMLITAGDNDATSLMESTGIAS